jgi:hypothetical protein
MDKSNLGDESFELDYIFESDKDIFSAFEASSNIYRALHEFDRFILLNIHSDIKIEYRLEFIEYGSLKSRVAQIIKSIPDDILKDPSIKKIIVHLLLKSKYWLLEKLSNSNTIDSKSQLETIANKINRELKVMGQKSQILVNNVSPHAVLNALSEIADEANKLPQKESYHYKSKFGNAILRKGIEINKSKILIELGQKTETSETKEIVKPKKVDLLSDISKWEFVYNGGTKHMKIEDKSWLESYHKREVVIEPGDSLKVILKTTYSYSPNFTDTKINYEIVRVVGIIKPDENSQLTIEQ